MILLVNLIVINGISPGTIKVTPGLSIKYPRAEFTASAVPFCSICSQKVTRLSKISSKTSFLYPTTTTTSSIIPLFSNFSTIYSIMGFLKMGYAHFGISLFILVPLPAANTKA